MSERQYLVCPTCERVERATERESCPACGSDRTYLDPEGALPDPTTEAYVKLDAADAAGESDDPE